MALVVEWGLDERREINQAEELEALLDRAHADARDDGRPQAVQISHGLAGTLSIVVGAARSNLNHVPANLDPPYLVSVGEDTAQAPFVFYVAGSQYTESHWRNTITMQAARAAVQHFAISGQLTADVD